MQPSVTRRYGESPSLHVTNATLHETGDVQTGIVRFDRQMACCIGGRLLEIDGDCDWSRREFPSNLACRLFRRLEFSAAGAFR